MIGAGAMRKGKRQKLKTAVTLAGSVQGKTHDRRSTDLLINAQVAEIEVDDPGELVYIGRGAMGRAPSDGKIKVLKSLRDDPLARMFARRQIDEAQMDAGRRWQRAYETAEGSSLKAIDPTKEAVDGGFIPEPFTDAKKEAAQELAWACRVVGQLGESLLRDVLGNRMFIEQIALARQDASQRSIDFYGRLFRESLDALAVGYGFAMRSVIHTTSSQPA